MKVNDMELPESPLLFLRALLGDERVDELGGVAFELAPEPGPRAAEMQSFEERREAMKRRTKELSA